MDDDMVGYFLGLVLLVAFFGFILWGAYDSTLETPVEIARTPISCKYTPAHEATKYTTDYVYVYGKGYKLASVPKGTYEVPAVYEVTYEITWSRASFWNNKTSRETVEVTEEEYNACNKEIMERKNEEG